MSEPLDTPPPPDRRGFTRAGLVLFVLSLVLVAVSAWLSYRSSVRDATRPWTGIAWARADTAERLLGAGMRGFPGVRPGAIFQLPSEGPGARAGLRPGDRVSEIGGVPATADSLLAALAGRARIGDTLVYRVARGADTLAVPVRVGVHARGARGSAFTLLYLAVALAWWLIGLFVWLRRPRDVRAVVFGLVCASATSSYVLTAVLGPGMASSGIEPAGGFEPAVLGVLSLLAVAGALFTSLLLHFALVFPRPRPVLRAWPESLPWVYAGGFYPLIAVTAAIAALAVPRPARPASGALAVLASGATLVAFLRRRVAEPGLRARIARQPWLAAALAVLASVALAAGGAAFAGPGLRPLRAALVLPALFTPVAVMVVSPLLFGALTIVSLLRSFRESGLEERQQLRWPLFGIVVSLGVSLLVTVATLVAAFTLDPQRLDQVQSWLVLAGALATVCIPLTFAVGILRFRLLDLDVVIRRTVVYGASLATLALVFLAAIVLAGEVAGRMAGRANSLVGPFATLVVALVAVPAFRRVRDGLDRRFFRTRYDTAAVLRRIGEAASSNPGHAALARRVAEELQIALRSRSVALLARGGNALLPAAALGVGGERFERLRVPVDDALQRALGRGAVTRARDAGGPLAPLARLARAEVLVPARHQGTLHGVLALGGKLSDESFSDADHEFLAAAAGLYASGLVGAEARSQRRELDEARQIQASLLPSRLPAPAGLALAAHWQPARHVAGDYYDAFDLGDGRLALCVADVTGKGMPAALLMSNLQATVRAFAPVAGGPAALCARLNAALAGQLVPGRFITFFYAELDPARRTVRFCDAGHNPPLLRRAGGREEWLDAGGPLLGPLPDAAFAEAEVTLASGDALVLYTDGVTEAQAPNGDLYGEDRLRAAVRAVAGEGAEAVQRHLLADAAAFCAGEFGDDATVLVVTVG
jgi:sigma-B regulation protein RsbU (phosphoserine phosphatase)